MPYNEKKVSAVEWLEQEYKKWYRKGNPIILKLIKQAKQMEEKQHENTWVDSRIEMKGDGYNYIGKEKTFEEYFKQEYQNQSK
jgi:hypothetical protein